MVIIIINYQLSIINYPMKPKAFVLYPNQWEPLSCLSDEQLGRLFRHIFTWLNDGSLDLQKEEQLVESDILLAFRFMRMQINIDIEKYQQLCELNRQKAMKRWEKQTNDAAAFSAMHKKEKPLPRLLPSLHLRADVSRDRASGQCSSLHPAFSVD